ncbi:MAG: uracil-DNA glycosylase family protein [Boseongicola sp.]|nr:MAG: uracil-DNA glycosylase family protein [Boseongicola sp.]
MTDKLSPIQSKLAACTICASKFAATKTQHSPRPIIWFSSNARILIAGQAPGMRVHEDGRPFWDPSGDRLRDWMGLDKETFYDRSKIAILPMAFCFPGYNAAGSDLPPPKVCADTWRADILENLYNVELTLLVGGYAQRWHLKTNLSVTDTVKNWREIKPGVIPLPHPSWRNTGWIKKNPWFEIELLPVLRSRLKSILK